MSDKMPIVSGREMAKILAQFGYYRDRQKGSHIILLKESPEDSVLLPHLTVPDHRELKPGTMMSILRKAEISREEFIRAFRRH